MVRRDLLVRSVSPTLGNEQNCMYVFVNVFIGTVSAGSTRYESPIALTLEAEDNSCIIELICVEQPGSSVPSTAWDSI